MIRLLETRRSVRKYKRQSVEREKVNKVLQAGLLAPTSRNRQPWEFLVVDDSALKYDLSMAKVHGSTFVKDSPVIIVILANQTTSDVWIEDASIATSYMQLEAERLGLGSCWVQIRLRTTKADESSENYVKKLLGIPGEYGVLAFLAMGYSDEDNLPNSVLDVPQEKVHYNGFGIPFLG